MMTRSVRRSGLARRQSRRSRGVAYAVVLLTTILVATIGFSGLAVVRVQGRMLQLTADVGVARRICLAGLDWAVFAIATDTSWRSNLGATWISNHAVGDGKVTVEAVDPIDGVLANDSLHPVDVTVLGVCGKARQKCKARIVMSPQRSVLACSLATDAALTVSSSLLNAEGPVYSDSDVTATSAQITADVEAVGTISGSSYAGTQQPAAELRKFPAANVTTFYNAVGTQISLTDLVSVSDNVIQNGDTSTGTTNWAVDGTGTLAAESSVAMAAVSPATPISEEPWLALTSRGSAAAGVLQNVHAALEASGSGSYRFRAVGMGGSAGSPVTFQVELRYHPEDRGMQTVVQTVGTSTGSWVTLQADFNLAWDDDDGLKTATIKVLTATGTDAIRLDNLSLRKLCAGCPYAMEKVLLSPTSNPYGTANPSGVYVVNCAGSDLIIRDLRIVGTLLLKNPGSNSRIEGMVSWEPAIANYPAVVVDGDMRISLTTGRLSEKTLMVNLNPAGTPYRYPDGMSDTSRTGYCDSEIRGLVYSTGRLTLGARSRFFGPVIARGDIAVTSQQVSLRYDDTYSLRPPPSFEDLRPEPQIVAGSIQQLVD